MIKAKLGDGKHANISVVDDCIELKPRDKEGNEALDNKLRIIPSADVDGIFIELYDKNGNFEYRTGITYIELAARVNAAKAIDIAGEPQSE